MPAGDDITAHLVTSCPHGWIALPSRHRIYVSVDERYMVTISPTMRVDGARLNVRTRDMRLTEDELGDIADAFFPATYRAVVTTRTRQDASLLMIPPRSNDESV